MQLRQRELRKLQLNPVALFLVASELSGLGEKCNSHIATLGGKQLCCNIENSVWGRGYFLVASQKIFDTFFNMRNAFYALKCFQLPNETKPNRAQPTPRPPLSSPAAPLGYCTRSVCAQTNSFAMVVHSCQLGLARLALLCAALLLRVSILFVLTVASLKRQLKSTAGRYRKRRN